MVSCAVGHVLGNTVMDFADLLTWILTCFGVYELSPFLSSVTMHPTKSPHFPKHLAVVMFTLTSVKT
jgi:hypothetical protein